MFGRTVDVARSSSCRFLARAGRRLRSLSLALIGGVLILGSGCLPASPGGGSSSGGDYTGTDLGGDPAPDFQLTDQRGEAVALSDLRGKVVALTFLDPRCIDICPITALELRRAATVLGPDNAGRVAFIAINANEAASPADVAAFTEQQKLDQIPGWRFLTGPPPRLAAVTRSYFVYAEPKADGRVDHTTGIFLIDAQGKWRRYLDVPPEQAARTRPGDTLAQQMRRLLT